MAEVRLPVWQFVRLMVQVEETMKKAGRGRAPQAVYDLHKTWDDTWLELDKRLEELGRNDPVAFSELMMSQDVVLTDATPRRKAAMAGEIRKVMKSMRATLKKTKDKETVSDLEFELDELEDLLYDIEE